MAKKTKDGTTPSKSKRSYSEQREVDRKSRANEARKRYDIAMRSTGRKKSATNYGKFKGETKKKK
jgi:hypothetical protein